MVKRTKNGTKRIGNILLLIGVAFFVIPGFFSFSQEEVNWASGITGTHELKSINADEAVLTVTMRADTLVDHTKPFPVNRGEWSGISLEGFVGQAAGGVCFKNVGGSTGPSSPSACVAEIPSNENPANFVSVNNLKNVNIVTTVTGINWASDWECVGPQEDQFTATGGNVFTRFNDCSLTREITVPLVDNYEGDFQCNAGGTNQALTCGISSDNIEITDTIPVGVRYTWKQVSILGIVDGEITASESEDMSGDTVTEIPSTAIEGPLPTDLPGDSTGIDLNTPIPLISSFFAFAFIGVGAVLSLRGRFF